LKLVYRLGINFSSFFFSFLKLIHYTTRRSCEWLRDFVSTWRFKILVAILAFMVGFMIMAVYTGESSSLLSQVTGFVTVPIQRLSSDISHSVGDFFDKFINSGKVYEQNKQLQEEVNQLREKLVDYDKVKHENDQFREIIGFKESRQDLAFVTASVIARDPADRFYSFTIDKGSLDDVRYLDPVMTADGLVGYVMEVGLTSSKVITILDVVSKVGVYSSSTRDIGIATGTIDLAREGLCQIEYLPRDSEIVPGDLILTSGGSLFPRDLIVGVVSDVRPNSHGTSLVAVVRPATEIQSVKDVFVITSFAGQGEEEEAG